MGKAVDKSDHGAGDNEIILEDSESESEDVFITEKDSGAWIGGDEDCDNNNNSMDCTIPIQLRVSEGQFSIDLWSLKYQPGFYDPSNGDKSKTLVLTITFKMKNKAGWQTEIRSYNCDEISSWSCLSELHLAWLC